MDYRALEFIVGEVWKAGTPSPLTNSRRQIFDGDQATIV